MASPTDLIEAVLADDDGTDPTSLTVINRRTALARKLHQMNAYIHSFRPWEWTYVSGETMLEANMTLAGLPEDFQEFSETGGAWRRDTGQPLVERSKRIVEDYRRSGQYQFLKFFAIWGGAMNFTYTHTGATIHLDLLYRTKPELIQDQGPEMLLPDKYVWTVLYPAFLARIKESKNDSRENWTEQLRGGLSEMCQQENPLKTEPRALPLARRRAW